MARRRRVSALFRWLVCFGLPVGGLFALFSSGAHRSGPWPFGIGEAEVQAYASVFDVRQKPAERVDPDAWRITIGKHTGKKKRKKLSDADWRAAWFTAEDYRDTVEVRRLSDGSNGWELRFPKQHYFKEQRRLLLFAVDERTAEVDEATALAKSLGLHVPERTRVTIELDGAHAVFVAEENIDDVYLDKRGYADAVLFTQGFGSLHPEHWRPDADGDSALAEEILFKQAAIMQGKGDVGTLIDLDATSAWLVMMEAEGRREDVLGEATFVLDRTTGRIAPLYAPRRSSADWQQAGTPIANIFRRLMNFDGFQERMQKVRDKATANVSFPRGAVANLQRPDGLIWLMGAPMVVPSNPESGGPVAVAAVESLKAIAERLGGTASGDTLRFVRGKYPITADVVTPPNAVVILEKGTRWFLGADVEVVVNGTITMNGTGPNPVFIRPADDAPHAGITVNGTEGTHCVINGLQMSGGGSKDGMLVFRNTDVRMEKSILNGSSSALVSVQRGNVELVGCAFMRTDGDGVHLTNCTGAVDACNFQGANGQQKGDGLVVVGGKVVVTKTVFRSLPGTGLNASSNAVVDANTVDALECGTGFAAVDGAQYSLSQATIAENKVGLHASRTQQHRKGGTFTLAGCTFNGNTTERQIDEASRVVERPD